MKSGWQEKRLGEVCAYLNRGVSPKYIEHGGIAVLNQKCVRGHALNLELSRRHDEKAKSVKPERLIRIGDVLVNSTGTGTLGRVAQVRESPPEPTTVDSHVTIVRPRKDLFCYEFFGYMLWGIEGKLMASGEGCGGQTELNRSVLAERFIVRFPSEVSDQRRISAKLDEAFAGLAKAKENAEKNLQNARALFESHLQAVFTQRGPGWVEKRLGDICKTGSGGTPLSSRREYYDGGDIPWLVSGEVAQGNVRTSKTFITKAGLENSSAKLFPKDTVLVAMYGATAGQVGILRFEAATNQAVCGILPNDKFVTEFLFYFFLAEKDKLVAQATGNAQPNISQIKIKNTVVPVPPLAEQQRIVDLLDSLHEGTQSLARLYEQKLEALESLKKSILHEAFSGNL